MLAQFCALRPAQFSELLGYSICCDNLSPDTDGGLQIQPSFGDSTFKNGRFYPQNKLDKPFRSEAGTVPSKSAIYTALRHFTIYMQTIGSGPTTERAGRVPGTFLL